MSFHYLQKHKTAEIKSSEQKNTTVNQCLKLQTPEDKGDTKSAFSNELDEIKFSL